MKNFKNSKNRKINKILMKKNIKKYKKIIPSYKGSNIKNKIKVKINIKIKRNIKIININ